MHLTTQSNSTKIPNKLHRNNKVLFKNNDTPRYMWVEKSYIFKFPLRYYYMNNGEVKAKPTPFNMFTNGFPFFILLIIGAIYGVFFKKNMEMEKRAVVYTLVIGFLLVVLGIFA